VGLAFYFYYETRRTSQVDDPKTPYRSVIHSLVINPLHVRTRNFTRVYTQYIYVYRKSVFQFLTTNNYLISRYRFFIFCIRYFVCPITFSYDNRYRLKRRLITTERKRGRNNQNAVEFKSFRTNNNVILITVRYLYVFM